MSASNCTRRAPPGVSFTVDTEAIRLVIYCFYVHKGSAAGTVSLTARQSFLIRSSAHRINTRPKDGRVIHRICFSQDLLGCTRPRPQKPPVGSTLCGQRDFVSQRLKLRMTLRMPPKTQSNPIAVCARKALLVRSTRMCRHRPWRRLHRRLRRRRCVFAFRMCACM